MSGAEDRRSSHGGRRLDSLQLGDKRIPGQDVLAKALEESKEAGTIDYILGAAHNPRSMLQVINSGRFDVSEFPFNIIEDEYIRKVIPLARQKDMGTVVMKPLGGGQLGSVSEYSLRWILNHDITCAIPGMRNKEEVKKNVRVGHDLQPLPAQE